MDAVESNYAGVLKYFHTQQKDAKEISRPVNRFTIFVDDTRDIHSVMVSQCTMLLSGNLVRQLFLYDTE